ncbi:response regulator transcription factor [Prosthecobacter sp.]|uniref:response regulator transcription factor n=1 Tax=Prosthecobacter sp. TaxID=1965333 RepID=UPI001DD2CB4A|nr:response regulator transcription factor [Prosthecobacter sp.]MCB1279400.1 response regulator transcription factor [Prosthecobacter sp.]
MKVLIVEDDQKTAALLTHALSQEGFVVTHATDGERGLREALTDSYDAMVTDIMLPKRDGLSLVGAMRKEGCTTPVIMLSARGEVEQRVEGLNAGADDYLAKPFAMSELVARLRSLLRRNAGLRPAVLTLNDLAYDLTTRETRRGGKRIELSSRESLLLECLMRAEGRVVSRRDIIEAVWEYDFDPGSNLVDVYVRRLREKIDRGHSTPLIQTVRGLGYALRLQP